jgi:tetratricopeptide (TPR) repeat protein
MTDLQTRLQTAVGDTYRIEQELGGGGMSRVFLAEEVRLGRKVVIKLLPPEMSAGVNVERFEREIQLAAKLQHPHIVPLLTAGAEGDLLFYVMPYIEGESLRAKLAREGELPVNEAVRILREVLDALDYAHENGVVHRDIKPDNVLLSRKHAVVTDFGVAKAVSASTGETSLTSLGVALGTPAYMAPEQAAADPHVDHRADIYAVGALAYEMLTGRPPFTGANPQTILSAHVTQAPDPVTTHRATVPPALASVVMRCLEKKAADRWQRADDLIPHLDALLTPSGGITPTGTQPVSGVDLAAPRTTHPIRVALLFGIASAVTLVVVYALMIALGLPDWVFVGAIALLAIGLPIMLVTGHHERKRAVAGAPGLPAPTPAGVRKHFTWKKAIAGGGLAFVGLGIVSVAYMAGRLLGIGPGATLMATGAIGEREPIVLAELDNRSGDTTLSTTVTELLRVSLSQSPVIRLVDPARLTESLRRMQQDPMTPVDETLALEIAEREGIKAVLSGDIVPLGSGYVVSARLVAADGTVLTAHQASARDAVDLMSAIDKLSADLRERMGESLRTIRRTVPLDLVTTGSLEALRLYTQAAQAEIAGDDARAIDLLEEAIGKDTTFAMAYRKLGIILRNNFEQRARAMEVLTKAYEFRDRLTDIERGYTIAQYHTDVTGERENALAAYRTILDKYPDDFRALNNSGVLYTQLNDFARGLEYYKRALATDSTWAPGFNNIAFAERALGRFDDAAATLDAMEARFPGNTLVTDARGGLAYAQRDYATAEQSWQTVLESQPGSPFWQGDASLKLAWVAATEGRLREAGLRMRQSVAATEQRGLEAERLATLVSWAETQLRLTQDVARARATLAGAVSDEAVRELRVPDRPYEPLVRYHVFAGDLPRARQVLADMESSGQPSLGRSYGRQFHRATGWVALAEGNYDRGITGMRRGTDDAGCLSCRLVTLAQAYDAAGNADSALAYWEQYAETDWRLPFNDHVEVPIGYRRIGELYEAAGNREKAVDYYNRFVELWQEADPVLQPQVRDVRDRISKLVGEGGVESRE